MPSLELRMEIEAPPERVFDLCRSVDVHIVSTGGTEEQAIAGRTSGLLGPGETVTWRARHLGAMQTLTSRMTRFDRPRSFTDSMVEGAFRRFDHEHVFTPTPSGTLVEDRFDFDSPLGPLGRLANVLFLSRYMERFLRRRLETVKSIAESDEWVRYLT